MVVQAVLIVNNHGKPRLARFYTQVDPNEQQQIIRDVYQTVIKRPPHQCNFVEWADGSKLVYRNFATLYFVFIVDSSESELATLDIIQTWVEILDASFKDVCELDLVFNFPIVNASLNEIVQGGLVVETNQSEVLAALSAHKQIEKKENPMH